MGVSGNGLWHTTIGNGPAKVLVIHGWFWDHRVFTPMFDALDRGLYTYAFVDIRGYGRSRDIAGASRSAKSPRMVSRSPTSLAGGNFT